MATTKARPEKGARARFTEQLIIMVTPEVKAHVVATSKAESTSVSEVGRAYLDAGIALGGGLVDNES